MLVETKMGKLRDFYTEGRAIDPLPVAWFETGKRINRLHTAGGREVLLRFLGDRRALEHGDVLYADESVVIVVEVELCAVIRIRPVGWAQVAAVCYEIGNKHLPLFIEGEDLLTPFDAPLLRQLELLGYDCEEGEGRLSTALRTTVIAHTHQRESLFSKILHRVNPGS